MSLYGVHVDDLVFWFSVYLTSNEVEVGLMVSGSNYRSDVRVNPRQSLRETQKAESGRELS